MRAGAFPAFLEHFSPAAQGSARLDFPVVFPQPAHSFQPALLRSPKPYLFGSCCLPLFRKDRTRNGGNFVLLLETVPQSHRMLRFCIQPDSRGRRKLSPAQRSGTEPPGCFRWCGVGPKPRFTSRMEFMLTGIGQLFPAPRGKVYPLHPAPGKAYHLLFKHLCRSFPPWC